MSKENLRQNVRETYLKRGKVITSIVIFFAITTIFLCLFLYPESLNAFEKLPEQYLISLGSAEAPIKIVEYFSLSCPICLKLTKEELPTIYKNHIETKKIHWTFHPDPQDITTLQLMICLEKLPDEKKGLFFWEALSTVDPVNTGKNTFILQELAKQFNLDLPKLHNIDWIKETKAFQRAFAYMQQKDAPTSLPALEVNGVLTEGFPTRKWLEEIMR